MRQTSSSSIQSGDSLGDTVELGDRPGVSDGVRDLVGVRVGDGDRSTSSDDGAISLLDGLGDGVGVLLTLGIAGRGVHPGISASPTSGEDVTAAPGSVSRVMFHRRDIGPESEKA